MAAAEAAITFACQGDTLVGVLAPGTPATANGPASAGAPDAAGAPTAPATVGVVIVVGGPQYRAGSHRQFVDLARHLAAAGHPVLRFDVRGMGDSEGAPRRFDALDADIAAAVDALCARQPQVQRVVLWGLCDGASAALLYVHRRADPRVAGLVLLNPWVRSEASLARTHVKHYYGQRLLQPEFWRKLLRGGVGAGALAGLWRNVRTARQAPAASAGSYQQQMARGWQAHRGPVLLVLSGQDYTAREFETFIAADPAWAAALQHPGLTLHRAPEADHTFSRREHQQALELVTARWLQTMG